MLQFTSLFLFLKLVYDVTQNSQVILYNYCTSALVNIAFQWSIAHHIAQNEVL